MGSEVPQERRIVVGVDGSPSSRQALRWAVEQARVTRGVVEAVTAWEYPATYGWSVPVEPGGLAQAAGHALADTVAEVVGADRPVEIRERVQCGNAAQVLLEAAQEADLLVVGSRGHGGFTGALLGSVGQHCVQHAPCPVVVVRHGRDERAGRAR
ncbi:universal stress protein [Kitasatospora sp. NPDC101157]|uniref:universal stress protein n=1 Tax=Kitasatospora sp. NPDC101157 TaxID=3364098 RepID=UPI00380A2F6D